MSYVEIKKAVYEKVWSLYIKARFAVLNKLDPTSFHMKGWFSVNVFGTDGKLKTFKLIPNLITSAGKAGAALRLSDTANAYEYLALGTGTDAAAADDTALQSEITDSGLARTTATVSQVTTTVTDDTSQLVHTWTATASKAITEYGVLNAASSGTLLARTVDSAVNISNDETIQVTYKIKCA